MKNLKNILVMSLMVPSFILFGCGRQPEWPTTTVNYGDNLTNYTKCAVTTDDTDGDCIPNSEDYSDNGTTCDIKCQKSDGSYVCKDCSIDADCNCNNIPDNEEEKTTAKCVGLNCIPKAVRYSIAIAAGLTGAYFGGRALNWFQGYGPDVTVTSVDFLTGSYLQFEKGSSGIDKMIIKINGKCDWEGHTDVPCNMEIKTNVLDISADWTPFVMYYFKTMDYFFDLKNSPAYSKEDNYIKVHGTDPTKGTQYEYILRDPAWLGIKTGIGEGYSETDMYRNFAGTPAMAYYLQLNRDDTGTTADERACFYNASGIGQDKSYIYGTWQRVNNSSCETSGHLPK